MKSMKLRLLAPKQDIKSKRDIMFEKYLEDKIVVMQGLERQALHMDFCRDLNYGIIQN